MGGDAVRIALESRNQSGHPAYWVDGRQRLATCTSVRVIGEHRLVCASLVGQALYLVEFDASHGHRVLDRIDTICGDTAVCTDLLDFDGNDLVATSNCEDSSVSFYRIDGDRLRHLSDLRIDGAHRGFCHGVTFVPGTDLVSVAIQSGAESFQLWSRSSGAHVASVADPGWMPKDSAFVAGNRMLALYSQTAKPQSGTVIRCSKLALIEFSADYQTPRKTAEWFPDTGHLDCISQAAGDVFVSDQGRNQVHRFHFDGELRPIESLDGFNFPHGVHYDAPRGRVAVSNYGSNSVELRAVAAVAP
jgi:hypothetical protein